MRNCKNLICRVSVYLKPQASYPMFEFLKFNAVLSVAKFIGLYIALALLPLLLFSIYKRFHIPAGETGLLDECIHHGSSLTKNQCQRVYQIILDVRAAIEHLRRQDGNTLPGRLSLTEAIALLPLLVEIGQPHTCCRQPLDTSQQTVCNYDCKRTASRFIEELRGDTTTPLIAGELAKITLVRRKIETALSRRRIKGWIFMAGCGIGCIMLADSIINGETLMNIGLAFYLGAILLFFSRYDYYYSQLYKRYSRKI